MRPKYTPYFIICLFIIFSSCENKEMQPINISIVTSTKIAESASSLMPAKIISFINPMECGDNAYIPSVTIYRTDLENDSGFKVEIPKESANELRNKFGTYDYNNLKDDYAEYIPELKAGEYLSKIGTKTSTKKAFNYSANDLVFVLTNKIVTKENNRFNNPDSIVSFIHKLICEKKFDLSKKIIILFDDNSIDNQVDSISADSAFAKFISWKDEKVRNTSVVDSTLQTLEHKYPNDYRFTLERLKLKNVGGVIKESDEYLLLLAVEKAIHEGKAADILAIINNMNLPKKAKEKIAQTITKKPLKEPVLPLDRALSFRKQTINTKLSILADASNSYKARKTFKDITLEYFESPTARVTIVSADSSMTLSIKTIDDYLDKLRFSKNYNITVVSIENGSNGKIASIRLTENF